MKTCRIVALLFIVAFVIFSGSLAFAQTQGQCSSSAPEIILVGIGDAYCRIDAALDTQKFQLAGVRYSVTVLKKGQRFKEISFKVEGSDIELFGKAYPCEGRGISEPEEWYLEWRLSDDTKYGALLKEANRHILGTCAK